MDPGAAVEDTSKLLRITTFLNQEQRSRMMCEETLFDKKSVQGPREPSPLGAPENFI